MPWKGAQKPPSSRPAYIPLPAQLLSKALVATLTAIVRLLFVLRLISSLERKVP